MYPWDLGCTGH